MEKAAATEGMRRGKTASCPIGPMAMHSFIHSAKSPDRRDLQWRGDPLQSTGNLTIREYDWLRPRDHRNFNHSLIRQHSLFVYEITVLFTKIDRLRIRGIHFNFQCSEFVIRGRSGRVIMRVYERPDRISPIGNEKLCLAYAA